MQPAAESQFHKRNHYVSRGYLKRWSAAQGTVATYRLLVSNERVPLWEACSLRRIAYQEHLYTRLVAGQESDEIERWLDEEFEAPAEQAILKATSGERLRREDWGLLARFFAAQYVRTPARLMENMVRWRERTPAILEQTLERFRQELELAQDTGLLPNREPFPDATYLPIRVDCEPNPDQETTNIVVRTILGRGHWLFSIRRLLTHTLKALLEHRWTILRAQDDLPWLTSDDPAICLNYYGPSRYDFKGGWGKPGSELILPLGPYHLLYTQVARRPPERGVVVERQQALLFRELIAKHAHRLIFAATPLAEVVRLRPRTVNPAMFKEEKAQWRAWHEEQSQAERDLFR